jgi:uncharacterized protein YndB with AHSA1/START domain
MTGSNEPNHVEHRVEHRMERSYEVAATPEQVWEAIATADGLSAWMVPARLDPQVGGEVWFDFGDFTSTGVVTEYSPSQRFGYEEPWPISADAPIPPGMLQWFDVIGVALADVQRDLPSVGPVATEFLIESASGGSCVIRVVSSSYGTGSDWENEFFTEMVAGWAVLLDNLVAHVERRDDGVPRP